MIPIFDAHADTPFELFRKNETLARNSGHISLERADALPNYAQFFAYCTYSGGWKLDRFYTSEELYTLPKKGMDSELLRHCDAISLCRNAEDLKNAWSEHKIAAFFSLEGAEGIGCDETRLDALYADGVRMVSLTWNADNALSGFHGSSLGLSEQGRSFVKKAQALGMILDVSHSSDQTVLDLAEIAVHPIIASHSNSRAVQACSRNLSDELFRAISQTGGLAGINLYSEFLTANTPGFESIYAHIDHFLSLCGDDHVALGGDLDGCDKLPLGFYGVDSYCALCDYLLTKYSETTVEKIFYRNLLRVLEACCK
ncbi:MAG: dipeptidase [Clostridia bacterium]|nr:dipeptidase [Clostridia bacterium]